MSWLKFAGNFVRHPTTVGAVAPSSRRLGERMVEGLDLATASTVVELGPGTGPFSEVVLERIGTETRFFAFELNPSFVKLLRARFPQLHVYGESAENLPQRLSDHGVQYADHIICGLPWASLPDDVQDRVFEAILAALPPGGKFRSFGYVHCRPFPKAVRFRKRLEEHFSSVEFSPIVIRNVPPAFVYRCVR